jgi:hypothetical protein
VDPDNVAIPRPGRGDLVESLAAQWMAERRLVEVHANVIAHLPGSGERRSLGHVVFARTPRYQNVIDNILPLREM